MKRFGRIVAFALLAALCLAQVAHAEKWQDKYPELTLGVITSENEKDRLIRYDLVQKYLEKTLGVEIKWRTATDYAGVIEGVKAGKIQVARFGPASYAKCHIVTNGKVAPMAGELDKNGNLGYHAIIVVKADSPFKKLEDLKGVKFAFADPNSTSGHQAPRYFLKEAGINADEFFGSTTFSGSHENSIMGLVAGTFDAAATWWRSDESNNPTRMEIKGMIEPGQWRIIWKSPRLPSSPWAMSTDLPEEMRKDVQKALLELPTKDPKAWEVYTKGQKISGLGKVTHEDYEPVVRMIKANLKDRKN